MELVYLKLERQDYYAPNPGQFRGTATFKCEDGALTVALSDKACETILANCLPILTDAAVAAASKITQE